MKEPIAVIGTGPAGVSAARALIDKGMPVVLIDAGHAGSSSYAAERPPLAALRQGTPDAWRYLVGDDLRGLRWMPSISPKLRMAAEPGNFESFAALNRIDTENFVSVGCLASGGLSNVWGAVGFAYDDADMAGWPISADALAPNYRAVSERIGMSGAAVNELDRGEPPLVLQAALPLMPLAERMVARHRQRRSRSGFKLDGTRMAVLTRDLDGRKACSLDNACMLGCHRGAIYGSAHEADELARRPSVSRLEGFVVEKLVRTNAGWSIEGRDRRSGGPRQVSAAKVVLAAGALASTRLALDAAGLADTPVRIENSPAVAFALLFPGALGTPTPDRAFGLTQLAFSLPLARPDTGQDSAQDPANEMIGLLYPAAAMSEIEFLMRMPVSLPGGIALMRHMLPALMIGLAYLPGRYSDNRARLTRESGGLSRLDLQGGYAASFDAVLKRTVGRLRRHLLRLGGILLPGSLQVYEPGAEVHYAGSLAMGRVTDTLGQLPASPGLHVVDGAVLPSMPARNPTLTIMANAERIGAALAATAAQ